MNTVNILGNIGQDPEIKYFESGSCVASFSVCLNRYSKKEEKNIANWVKCKVFGKTAENITKYFKKGTKIAITGELATDTYENEKGKQSITYIIVNKFDFCDTKKDNKSYESSEYVEEINEDEIPF